MLYQQIAQNKRRTIYVIIGFSLLVALVGAAVGYLWAGSAMGGIIISLVLAWFILWWWLGNRRMCDEYESRPWN